MVASTTSNRPYLTISASTAAIAAASPERSLSTIDWVAVAITYGCA